MIRTTNELKTELERLQAQYGNNIITVRFKDREYIIEDIGHTKKIGDESSHMCLDIRQIEGHVVV